MDAKRRVVLGALCGVMLVFVTGCPFAMPGDNTNNKGGGSLITAGLKFANDNLGALTADEIQIVTDLVIEQAQLPIDPLTDEHAAVVVTFIDDNNLNTIEDFRALQYADIDDLVISDEVREVLESDQVLEIIETLTWADFGRIDWDSILGG